MPRTLILISPTPRIPPDLESLVTLVDFPLPTEPQIRATLDGMIARNTAAGALVVDLGPAGAERLAKAALGLTAFEAENAFARSMVDDGRLTDDDIALVQEEKRQIVQKSGVLEVVRSTVSLDDIGGLENLKTWLRKRNGSWLDEAAAYGLPAPKGVLVTGVPGCGKSLTAKAMASAWSLPLVRLDIGRVFGGLVGAVRAEHADGAADRRGDRAVRDVDRRDREGLRLRGFRVGGQRDIGPGVRHVPELDAGEDGAGVRDGDGEQDLAAAAGDDAQGPVRRDLLHRPAHRHRAPGDLHAAPEGPAQGRPGAGCAAADRRRCWTPWWRRPRGSPGRRSSRW